MPPIVGGASSQSKETVHGRQGIKVLGFLPKNYANSLLGILIVTVVIALIWSWLESLSFSADNAWVLLIEMLLLAALVGYVVGMHLGNDKASTLWTAAGFAVVGTVLTGALMAGSAADLDVALLGSLGAEAFAPSVSIGYVVLAIVAAVFATIGSKSKV